MSSRLFNRARALLGAALALLAPVTAAAQERVIDPAPAGDLAVMGTIPIYWGERDDLADLLSPDAAPHWARAVIETHYRLRPLDYLSAEALQDFRLLLLAQPRGLSGQENVALDAWVRAGGRALLFADPAMTGHSRFAIGDRRRRQDVALLSPILAHWGLELRFDDRQPEGRHLRDSVPPLLNPPLPVDLPGELVLRGETGECTLLGEGIAAECRLGSGAVLVVADAALLESDAGDQVAVAALDGLMSRIFGVCVPRSAPVVIEDKNN